MQLDSEAAHGRPRSPCREMLESEITRSMSKYHNQNKGTNYELEVIENLYTELDSELPTVQFNTQQSIMNDEKEVTQNFVDEHLKSYVHGSFTPGTFV